MIAATPGRRRLLRAVRALLGLAILALPFATPVQAHARASVTLDVVLTAATISGTAPTDTLTLSGLVANHSDTAAFGVRAQLWRSTTALRAADAVDAALAGSGPTGRTVTTKPEHSATVTGPDAALAPGETRTFSVQGTLADVGLTTADASYLVGVNVRGAASASAAGDTTQARTLVTLPGASATPVATVVELSATPRQLRPNLFADDRLAEELDGRLRTLLDAAAQPGVSWVVDPSLVAEVSDLADGYRVVDGDGSAPGEGTDVAKKWLADFRALPTASGYQSLFARPDITAAVALRDDSVLAHARAAATPALGLPTLVTLDRVDSPTLRALGPDHPVLTRAPRLQTPSIVVDGTRVVEAVTPDEAWDAHALADTPLNRTAVLVAQARAHGGQVRVVSSQAGLDADRAAAPTWVARTTLTHLLGGQAPVNGRSVPVDPDATDAFDAETSKRGAALAAGLATYASVAPDSRVGTLADAQAARAASLAWTDDLAGRDAWLTLVDARAGRVALARGLSLSASPRFTMTAAESDFPVTVTNTLPDAVAIRLVPASDSPQRIRISAGDVVTVAPGASQGASVHASASGNGVASGTIHVATEAGTRLTADVPLVLEATNLGRVGWVIVVVSGLVLIVSTALRIRQVRRRTGGADVRR